MTEQKYDVVIIGAGPVGLILGCALQRMKVSTVVVERLVKKDLPMFGRATTLYPRTLELLDQLDLLEILNQVAVIARSSVNYKDGRRVTSRGWHGMFSQMGDTFQNYCINIRLKYSEELIAEAYLQQGGKMLIGWEIENIDWNNRISVGSPGSEVNALLRKVGMEERQVIRSYFLVGADGGSSTVRKLAGITMPLDTSTNTLIRIDGLIKTDMPEANFGFASIESPTHGNVLWVTLDHGCTRIGYSLNPRLVEKYGQSMTREQIMHEAEAAMAPFKIKFERVDWHTIYKINQGVADRFMVDGRIILAGDACHIHSSAAAQGMNTGVHDAVNLAWKLGGVIRGWYLPSDLETYELERRAVAQQLIQLDREISSLIRGVIPEKYGGDSAASSTDVNELLRQVFEGSAQFTIGLGIHYPENLVNKAANYGCLISGRRAPDGLLHAPGPRVPHQLQKIIPNRGSYSILVFTGNPLLTIDKLRSLRASLDQPSSFAQRMHTESARFLSILPAWNNQALTAMQNMSFGRFWFDPDNSVYDRYGFSAENGGIAVLRPDGILAFATQLTAGDEIGEYFSRVARMRETGS